MFKKSIRASQLLAESIFFVVLGIVCFKNGTGILQYVLLILSIFLILRSIKNFLIYIIYPSKEVKWTNILFHNTIDIGFASLIYFQVDFILNSLTVMFGLYVLLQSICFFIHYLIYFNNGIRTDLKLLIGAILFFIFSILLFCNPSKNMWYAEVVIALYFILYGASMLLDFIWELIPNNTKIKWNHQTRISLPIILNAFVPQKLIEDIHKSQKKGKRTDDLFNYEKTSESPDVEVLIHLAKNGSAAFGHVEIVIDGINYSYGNYNRHSRHLFDAIGDGIIAISEKQKYISYLVYEKNRMIVEFGLRLTNEQKALVKKRIQNITNENTINWYPDYARFLKKEIPKGEYNDMSSQMYKMVGTKFKKITNGKNKTYFVFKTNCVFMADYILNPQKNDILSITGIICPGTYYEYLNNQLKRKKSNVISRKIYTKDNVIAIHNS